jgi:hypothetical protein
MKAPINTQKLVLFAVGFAIAFSVMNVAYTFSHPQEGEHTCLQ